MGNPGNIFNSIYDDFFSLVNKTSDSLDEAKIREKFLNAELNMPKIEVKPLIPKEEETTSVTGSFEQEAAEETQTAEQKEQKLNDFYERIDNLLLTEDSKTLLKKMVTYAYKFNMGLAKIFIAFNMKIYSDNNETLDEITSLITECFQYFKYIKPDGIVATRSFYEIEEDTDLANLFAAQNGLVILKDINGIINKDSQTKEKFLNILQKSVSSANKAGGLLSIITDSDKVRVNDLLANNPSLKDKLFEYELFTVKATVQDVYQSILSTLKEHYTLEEQFEVDLLDYISETYEQAELTPPEYKKSLIEKIILNQSGDKIDSSCIPSYDRTKSIEEIFAELDALTGLQNIKKSLHELVDLMEFKSKTTDKLSIKDTNLHMVFLGNPGTGKTTVARMIAGILYNLKYIDTNKLIEVSAKDLIGQYVGQTAPKTMEVINRAMGGVLFIDEAYSLASTPGSNNSFNEECVATLIQAMENYRDDLIVIFAGYSKEMDGFLKSNSGIVSRIGYTFEFKDYTVAELITILKSMFKKAGFTVDKKALEKAEEIINEYRGTQGFGNARFVRNLYEKAIIKHASNTQGANSIRVLKKITADDITDDNLMKM